MDNLRATGRRLTRRTTVDGMGSASEMVRSRFARMNLLRKQAEILPSEKISWLLKRPSLTPPVSSSPLLSRKVRAERSGNCILATGKAAKDCRRTSRQREAFRREHG